MSNCQIDIIIAYKPWRQGHYEPLIQETVNTVLSYLHVIKPSELCIKLTSNADIQKLHAHYLGKNYPTNVLSFPLPPTSAPAPQSLGDIVLAFETIQTEALAQKKIFEHHLTHLVVHGLLHLLGYDHVEASDAIVMESLENKILQTLGIKDPYENHGK